MNQPSPASPSANPTLSAGDIGSRGRDCVFKSYGPQVRGCHGSLSLQPVDSDQRTLVKHREKEQHQRAVVDREDEDVEEIFGQL
jgi:hypothetical protein